MKIKTKGKEPMESKETQILEAAEQMVREGGYNAFSFREIAATVGIKSSSVHYHFPTKADLGAAVAAYYTDKLMNYLGTPEIMVQDGKDPIDMYIKVFRNGLTEDKRMCLFGMLGAEIKGLPSQVSAQTKVFFERNIEWLTKAYTIKGSTEEARSKAVQTISLLEGAMIASNVMNDIKVFDQATASIKNTI